MSFIATIMGLLHRTFASPLAIIGFTLAMLTVSRDAVICIVAMLTSPLQA